MASDDEDQMRDLFGSDDEDGDADFGKGRLRQAGAGEDGMEEDAAAEEGLEDDLELGDADAGGPGRGGRQVAVSEEPEEEEAAAEGQRAERRRRPAPPGHRPLAKTAQAIDHAAPLLPVPPPINDVYLLREALISIEPVPFNPETYAGEDEIFTDEKGYTKVKPVDSTKIRWRYVRRKGADGREQMLPESNARFVRWSDGSLQLLLGEEVFDVDTADISAQHAYMVAYSGVVQVGLQLRGLKAIVLAVGGSTACSGGGWAPLYSAVRVSEVRLCCSPARHPAASRCWPWRDTWATEHAHH